MTKKGKEGRFAYQGPERRTEKERRSGKDRRKEERRKGERRDP